MGSILLIGKDGALMMAVSSLPLFAFWVIPRYQRHRALSRFPIHGTEYGLHLQREKEFLNNSVNIYMQGYQKFRDIIYRMTTADGERVVLPLRYLEELRLRPDDEIDIYAPMRHFMESKNVGYGSGTNTDFLSHVIRSALTRNLSRINPNLYQEVERTVKDVIPPTDDWVSYGVEESLVQIITVVSGSIFVGPQLCRTPEYKDACANFSVHLFRAIRALKQWPRWIRSVGRYFTPGVKRVQGYYRDGQNILIPVIKERREKMRLGEKMPDDVLQWMLVKAENEGVGDEALCDLQLTLIMAAIHTTSRGATEMLFDLAACPEVVLDLRREIETVLAEHGGVMTTQALFQMKLLDSVMKESHRMSPPGLIRFVRYICKPMTLSDGTYLPAGTTIQVPWYPVTRDESIYPGADKYDPYRFYRIRTGTDGGEMPLKHSREQYQFASVTDTDMAFGYGRHACPGRFFATAEIKLILAKILLDYDISLPKDVDQRHARDFVVSGVRIPFPGGKIRLRRRRIVAE